MPPPAEAGVVGLLSLAPLRGGAVCVDIYSAFIYRGGSVARAIDRERAAAGGASIARTG